MCLQSAKNTKWQVKTTFQLLLMHRNQTTLSDGWSGDIKQMPFSMCAHFSTVSAITCFRKNDTPHNLKVALCIFRGQECLWPGQFLQTYFGSFVKIMQVSLYESKSVTDLENEDNMQPKWICTSTLKQWHR